MRDDHIDYKLAYGQLEGDVTQAHIHFGSESQTGGISAFLCQRGQATAPAGTPECPAGRSGSVEGTIEPSDVHSTKYTGGEVRAQLERGHHDD